MTLQPRDGREDQVSDFDVFLSYNRKDRAAVERFAVVLQKRGLAVFKDDWYLRPGEFWPTALEQKLSTSKAVIVMIGRDGLGSWQQRELVAALDRQDHELRHGKPVLPVIPVLLEQGCQQQAGLVFLLQNTWIEAWDPRVADLIKGAILGKAPAQLYSENHVDPRTLICPYRGLDVFREEDAVFYFGREADLEGLVAAVTRHPLVAVVGASGSGKSSLVRAGLFRRLQDQVCGQVWQTLTVIPGRDPYLALAHQLLPLREPERCLTWSLGDIDDECDRSKSRLMRDGAKHLSHVLAQILEQEPGTTRVLILVDQWEELYTHVTDDIAAATSNVERVRRFVEMLLETIKSDQVQVVLTLRADYWGEVLNDQSLSVRLPDQAIIHLRPLDRKALADVICKPAERIGLGVPGDLTEVLLDAALGQPGDLPLLEFTLHQLWIEQRRAASGALSLEDYRAMGGLEKAIVSRADKLFDRLDQKEQLAVPGVFAALVQVGEVRSDLRRRARLAELSEEGQAVARRFANERLLVTSRDWATGDDLVEVAHEALLRHWPKLEAWIDARRRALLTIRQLQADCQNWIERRRNPNYLWSHERVREATGAILQLSQEVILSDAEQAFLGPIHPNEMLAEREQPETTHRRRALIGERLDVLGDPRPGVGVDTNGSVQIEWCDVTDGEIAIQVQRRLLGGTKWRSKRVDAFQIARYPITVAQYRAFLEAEDGWCDSAWWADDLYRDPDGDTYDVGRFGNHPAVYVSWFDATAFCRWLGKRLDRVIRLPNEWEWQRAATGGDIQRTYPWGPDWDPKLELHRANTAESYLGRATAVGMYPAGASPANVRDMSGTVWEWCLNKYDNLSFTKFHALDFESRTVRGGSCLSVQSDARCLDREPRRPELRYYLVGFRILCSSSTKDR